jgi:hypothetical protein
MIRIARIAIIACCLFGLPVAVLGLTYTTPTTTDGLVESSTPALGGTTWETDELMANDGGTSFYLGRHHGLRCRHRYLR